MSCSSMRVVRSTSWELCMKKRCHRSYVGDLVRFSLAQSGCLGS